MCLQWLGEPERSLQNNCGELGTILFFFFLSQFVWIAFSFSHHFPSLAQGSKQTPHQLCFLCCPPGEKKCSIYQKSNLFIAKCLCTCNTEELLQPVTLSGVNECVTLASRYLHWYNSLCVTVRSASCTKILNYEKACKHKNERREYIWRRKLAWWAFTAALLCYYIVEMYVQIITSVLMYRNIRRS